MDKGCVFLVGAGPGAVDLITVAGLRVLKDADIVVYDRLVPEELLSFSPRKSLKVYVGKRSGRHELGQEEINKLLIRHAKAGKKVVRLKGGDPFLFGRGGEEAESLAKAKVRFEMIPGVTSALAVPAIAGIPLTHRKLSSSVAIVTGHEDPEKKRPEVRWKHLAKAVDTLVILMGAENIAKIAQTLIKAGVNPRTEAASIEWGTTDQQKTITGTLEAFSGEMAEKIMPPSVIVIGKVVRLAEILCGRGK